MIGIVTKDKVCYLGDCMFGASTLSKYKIPYVYDVDNYKKTIEKVRKMEMNYFVMSHGSIVTDITDIADKNISVIRQIENDLLEIVQKRISFDDILQELCNKMCIVLDYKQYALVGNTVRSFLSYLYNSGQINYEFLNNRLVWSESREG